MSIKFEASLIIYLLVLLTHDIVTDGTLTSDNEQEKEENGIGIDYKISSLNRTSFPPSFIFGTASSAYQYEGAANVDGRGPSIWDTYTHKFAGRITDRNNGDIADDSYNRYKEDVRILKEMGMDAYRFSISWSRILPYGKISKGVNIKGIIYYHNLIDELLANGIQPFVTLFHWDLPQALQDEYGGFLSPRVVDDFRDYADLCFREFGGKVKYWMTLNEPWTYSVIICTVATYSSNNCPRAHPENCAFDYATGPYVLAHYQLLAHAAAVEVYRQKYQAFQRGMIGIALGTYWFLPFSEASQDHHTARRALDFMFKWYMDPLAYGRYPYSMLSRVGYRLPMFSRQQSIMVKGSYDFLGINYYTSGYAAYAPSFRNAQPSYFTDPLLNYTIERDGIPIGPMAASFWLHSYPRGIYDLLLHIKRKYKDPLIYITENGWDEYNNPDLSLEEAVTDTMRIKYHQSHLSFVQDAIRDGVTLRGYFVWSLLDNFEWFDGYSVRFGLNYVDYKDGLKRYPKHSAQWFKNFLQK